MYFWSPLMNMLSSGMLTVPAAVNVIKTIFQVVSAGSYVRPYVCTHTVSAFSLLKGGNVGG
jgi:hypothetical protein